MVAMDAYKEILRKMTLDELVSELGLIHSGIHYVDNLERLKVVSNEMKSRGMKVVGDPVGFPFISSFLGSGDDSMRAWFVGNVGRHVVARLKNPFDGAFATGIVENGHRGPLIRHEEGTYTWYYRFDWAMVLPDPNTIDEEE